MSIDQRLAARSHTGTPDPTRPNAEVASGEFRTIDGETWYRVANVDRMAPFFMSLICSEDHWMYVASNGALTCGRRDANQAIFPYYSADKILDSGQSTGPTTIIRMEQSGRMFLWEPFSSQRNEFETQRTLYKNRLGNRILFEETNLTLGLTLRYQWSSSRSFGFVRTVDLINLEAQPRKLTLLDGFQNLLPPGLDQNFQLRFSNLADAYKRAELLQQSDLGLFYLNSIPTDRAEPSEGLQVTVAWQTGLDRPIVLLSNRQLERFRLGGALKPETEVRGQRQCYFVAKSIELGGRDLCTWRTIVDVGYDHARLLDLSALVSDDLDVVRLLEQELVDNDQTLLQFAAASDGLQASADPRRINRHLANTIFNVMRGGLPVAGYQVRTADLLSYLGKRNREVLSRLESRLLELPPELEYSKLLSFARTAGDSDLVRLVTEFLPLTFSRRHGDPTRPWNQFRIPGRNEQGARQIGFEGNWRDIFQNWEALSSSFPGFLAGMVTRFVNASTVDGFNPYRVNESGFDWERPDPADPWANIGYWGDHQIVYLHKLLEKLRSTWPDELGQMLTASDYVYADIPYRITNYQQLRANPRETISYDEVVESSLRARAAQIGTDGYLATDSSGRVHRICLAEKLLLSGLVKLANLIPGAGIWLNTQRPEWNDAQNALAGFGASIVTVGYLRKYLELLRLLLTESGSDELFLSSEVAEFLESLQRILGDGELLAGCCRDEFVRDTFVSQMQIAAERHREAVYAGFRGDKRTVATLPIRELLARATGLLTETLQMSRRPDGLFHSFNLVHFSEGSIRVGHLEEMLEGQVSILESGVLSPEQCVELLTALRQSRLYRPDQHSYLLYPDRDPPRFLEKNRIRIDHRSAGEPQADHARKRELVQRLASATTSPLVKRDRNGDFRFSGKLRNFADFKRELLAAGAAQVSAMGPGKQPASPPQASPNQPETLEVSAKDLRLLEEVWEQTFEHRKYAGRSSSFFAYEGLGSIYWHMVSKLSYAVARQCLEASRAGSPMFSRLAAQFRDIFEGMWLHKSPETYGAIPTDPYSHTPAHAGAQQPGMTGQVKEDLLTRLLELGVVIESGRVAFHPVLLRADEFLESPFVCSMIDTNGNRRELELGRSTIAFTLCQTPVVFKLITGDEPTLTIEYQDGGCERRAGSELTREESNELFSRTGRIRKIEYGFKITDE
ncbi:MAG: hypothetical protein ACK52Y_07295 [Planctomycetota bacterium]|jgi:hypothetical protein